MLEEKDYFGGWPQLPNAARGGSDIFCRQRAEDHQFGRLRSKHGTLDISRRGEATDYVIRMTSHQGYQRLAYKQARFNDNCGYALFHPTVPNSTVPHRPQPKYWGIIVD